MDQPTTPAPCICCHRPRRPDETGHACRLCQHAGTRLLYALPGLYRATAPLLQPGRTGTTAGPVTGSKHAPLPVRLDVLDLRAVGGLTNVITGWESAVRDELGWDPAPFRGDYEQTLTAACRVLADNTPWIYTSFAVVDDLHHELRQWHQRLTRLITGEPPERRLHVACTTCGSPIPITLTTPGRRCGCGQQYGWSELRHLPLAERVATAA